MEGKLVVEANRDSVAMGDSMVPHRRTVEAYSGIRLRRLLAWCEPEIRERGWSWVAFAEGRPEPLAVWSVDHGVKMLVADTPVTQETGPLSICFEYFMQTDPQWLHARLAEGAPPKPWPLSEEFRGIEAAWRAEQDRRKSPLRRWLSRRFRRSRKR